MVMSAVGSFIILVFVNRNAAIIVMMMMVIHPNLSGAMRRAVNGPSRHRNAHAKRQPDESEQTQQGYTAIHAIWLGYANKMGNREFQVLVASQIL